MDKKDNSSLEVKHEDIQTAAWQDEFTREFLVSSEETEEGYYTFKSGIDGYTMLYPVNAIMDPTYYQYEDTDNEVIYFWEDRKQENYGYYMKGRYENNKTTQFIDSNLRFLIGSEKLITTKDFEKNIIEDKDIYFAEFRQNINEDKNGFYLTFLGYVKSHSNHKAISLEYSSTCLSETEECKLDVNQERERAKKIFHSVNFSPS